MARYAYNAITGRLDRVGGGGGGSGNVSGPGSSIDNDIVIFDGTTGKIIKDTGISSINPEFEGSVSALNFNLPTTALAPSPRGFINMSSERFVHASGNISNFFAGYQSGSTGNSSDGSTGVGNSALSDLTSGISNTAFGHVSMGLGLTSGNYNSAFGEGTMFFCSGSVNGCVAIGWHTMIGVQGDYNIGFGFDVMSGGVSGTLNLAGGFQALKNLLTGSNNLTLGTLAGFNYTSSESGNICLYNQGVAGDNNVTRLGNSGTQECYLYGISNTVIAEETLVVIDSATDRVGTVPGKPQVILKSPLVSMVGGGTRVLAELERDFIVTGILSRTVASVGASGDFVGSVGFNSPAYDNLVGSGILLPFSAGNYNFATLNTSNNPVVPSGSSLVLNINNPDSTATTLDANIYVTGFYA